MDRNITQNFSGDTSWLNGQSLFKLLYDRGHDGIFFFKFVYIVLYMWGPSWSWSYGSTTCAISSNPEWRGVLDTTIYDKVCQWLATGRWFSPISSTNKGDHHDITEILLKVALSTINQPNQPIDMILFLLQKNIRHLDHLFLMLYCWHLLSLE